ncbi:MAG TPA: hypothetical protein DEB06_04325, partial [Phycisphaerales bacterium]|nr:hypothetical protein [Phycisphaerales bacterium]
MRRVRRSHGIARATGVRWYPAAYPERVVTALDPASPVAALERWFGARGWAPFEFQREAWGAYLAGRSGLVH